MFSSAFGLGAVTAWRWLTFLEGHLLSVFPERTLLAPQQAFLLFTLLHGLGLFAAARRLLPFDEGRVKTTLVLGALLSSASQVPFLLPGYFTSWVWGFLFTLVGALGATILFVLWCWHLTQFSPAASAFLFGCANVLSALIITFSPWIPREILLALTLLLPFVAAWCWRAPSEGLYGARAPSPLSPSWGLSPYSPKLMLRIGSFFFTCSLFHALLLTSSSPELYRIWKVTEPLYSMGALTTGLLIWRFAEIDLRNLYRMAQTLLGLGFATFLFLGGHHPLIAVALLQTGYGVFGTYAWVLLLYLASRAGRKEALAIASRGHFGVVLSVLVGIALTQGAQKAAMKLGLPLSPFLSLLAIATLFLAGLAFDDDRETFAGYDLPLADGDEECGEGLSLAGLLEADLTRQERRVALLVAERCSNADICGRLNITTNTVRTHLKNIYRKLDVSGREELQDHLASLGKRGGL